MQTKFTDSKYDLSKITLWDFLQEGNYPSGWSEFFLRGDIQEELQKISNDLENVVKEGITVFPSLTNIFRAFYSCPPDKIRLVINGQDPYTNGSAVGLCFSVKPGNEINSSLLNIYKEQKNSGYKPRENGDLTHLPKQGVLMLNSGLTVEKGFPESHLGIWYPFTKKVIEYIKNRNDRVLWLVMGAKALSLVGDMGEKSFITSHPSGYSAHKGFRDYPAFIGSKVFEKINKSLEIPIVW